MLTSQELEMSFTISSHPYTPASYGSQSSLGMHNDLELQLQPPFSTAFEKYVREQQQKLRSHQKAPNYPGTFLAHKGSLSQHGNVMDFTEPPQSYLRERTLTQRDGSHWLCTLDMGEHSRRIANKQKRNGMALPYDVELTLDDALREASYNIATSPRHLEPIEEEPPPQFEVVQDENRMQKDQSTFSLLSLPSKNKFNSLSEWGDLFLSQQYRPPVWPCSDDEITLHSENEADEEIVKQADDVMEEGRFGNKWS